MQKYGVLYVGIKAIALVLAAVIINSVLYLNCSTYSTISEENSERITDYWELKEYRLGLRQNINQYKKEKSDKEAYLEELDKRFEELEAQYKELLEQKKRISDELAAIDTYTN